MASLTAMASVTEDFDTQPCKKHKKDGETSSVKTITNYFLPMPKPTEKPFSSPKSNILDYFRKTSTTVEKTDTSELANENRQNLSEAHGSAETAAHVVKSRRLRKGKKLSKEHFLSKGSKDAQTEGPSEVITVSQSDCLDEGDLSAGDSGRSPKIFGSDTAVFLAQISTETLGGQESVSDQCVQATGTLPKEEPQGNPHRRSSVKQRAGNIEDNAESLESTKGDGRKSKRNKANCKPDAVLPKQHLPETQEAVQSLSDTSLETNVDAACSLNDSTVTISFEDFLQSQNQDEGSASLGTNENDNEMSTPTTTGNEFRSQTLSPRTLTVQAEVHPVSPELELVNPRMRKLASIFTRRQMQGDKESRRQSPSHPQENTDFQPTPKRKSNVVLQEEDLELAVIETGSTLKCTQAERKQFMNAFRQPGLEAGKSKLKKGLSKQEEVGDKTIVLQGEETPSCKEAAKEEKDQPQPEDDKPAQLGKKGHNKLQKAGKKKSGEETPVLIAAPEKKPATEGDGKAKCLNIAGDHTITPTESKGLRRSTRGQAQEITFEQNTPTQSPVTRNRNRLRNQQKAEGPPQDSPTMTAMPKTYLSKHRMYRVEMLSPPDDNSSPIRMRFQCVSKSKSKDASDFVIESPSATQKSRPSKSREQAKKLVEKAKALQQNKNAAAGDNKGSLRRSTRTANLQKNSHFEKKDPVVCLEEKQDSSPAAKGEVKGQKQLRNLNEVLGKKATNSSLVSKVAPVFLCKKAQKPAAVISIFDDSSRDGSENSQDDEQFRARREFLKSGLPESFKKQMARTAASRDAYSTASASFQPVVHVLQRPLNCPLWNLPWPGSSLLKKLEKTHFEVSNPVLSLQQLHYTKTHPALRPNLCKGTGWGEEFSEAVRNCLAEEVRVSNPRFPTQRFLAWFLKRRAEHILQCASSEPDKCRKATSTPGLPEPAKRKRKRCSQEEGGDGGTKRRRSSRGEPIMIEDDSPPVDGTSVLPSSELAGQSRLSRTRARRQQKTRAPVSGSTPVQNCSVIVIDDIPPSPENSEKGGSLPVGSVREDVLWTEKYQPQHSSEIIGNLAAVRKLHSWLKEWKQRADCEEGRTQREKKHVDDSNDSWDCGDFRGEEGPEAGEDALCNTLLITGPPGVGKTAAVYACAQELGFKVFEVNASSQRNGRQILSQLKEATQSHQVDLHGPGALKPSYFNSQSSSSNRSGPSPGKATSPRRSVSSPRKFPQSPRSAVHKKSRLAPTSLINFFKTGTLKDKNSGKQDSGPQKDTTACPVRHAKAQESILKDKDDTGKDASAEELSKKPATSLILFEEVDVIFEEDSGFLTAIKTFMTTTKRPVILTTSDPTFSTMFDGSFEEIRFKTPSLGNVSSYLQLLCLAENMRVDSRDLTSLATWKKCDIRQCLLYLQFWVRSGGGRPTARPLLAPSSDCRDGGGVKPEKLAEEKDLAADAPHCHSSCMESLLGLLNIRSDLDPQEVCKCKSAAESETQRCWDLLTESWGRGVDLLYTNMEELLPLPVRILETQSQKTHEARFLHSHGNVCELSNEASPTKVSSRMRRKRCSGRTEQGTPLDSDSDDDFLSLHKATKAATNSELEQIFDVSLRIPLNHSAEKPLAPQISFRELKKTERSPAQQRASKLVSSCLDSMADLFDCMSFLDSSLQSHNLETEGACVPGTLGWTGAEVKSGLTDELREGNSAGGCQWGQASEIRAVTESLSFQRCQKQVAEVWAEAQNLEHEVRDEVVERLSLPVAPHRRGFSLCESSLCEPSVIQMRRDVLRTLSSRVLSMMGNRPAAATDYLPSLRAICRSERLKEQGKVKRRFLHYLDGIHLSLPRNTVQLLAEDFP